MRLVAGASPAEATRLLEAIAKGGSLAKEFARLATDTRTRALVALDRTSRGATTGAAATSKKGTDNKAISDPGTTNPMISNTLTNARSTNDPFGTKRPVLPRDTHDDPVARQSRVDPTHKQSRRPQWEDEEGWQVVLDFAQPTMTAELRAILEEVRVTPRLVRKFAWGEIQTYLALSLKKASARRNDYKGFDFESEMGPYGLRRALDTVTGTILIRQKGIAISHSGITWKEASLEVDFNAKFSPTHPMSMELKHSRLISHIEKMPPFEMAMDFEVAWIVEVMPTADEIKRRLGQVIYKAQRFFENHGRAIVERGRNAIRASVQRLSRAGRWAGRALFRSSQASARGARALWRAVVGASRYVPGVLLGLDAALATVDLLAYLGTIAMENDRQRSESWFWRGFIRMYHSRAFDPVGRKGIQSQIEQVFYMNTLSGVDLGVRLSDDEVERWIASGVVSRNKVYLAEVDWPVAYDNARRLYSKAWNLPIGGRGAILRDALEQSLIVCGEAAALQELLAFIASQSFDYYEGSGPSAKLRERDGFEAWDELAIGYQHFVLALAEGRDNVPQPADPDAAGTTALMERHYKAMNGFPMLPG